MQWTWGARAPSPVVSRALAGNRCATGLRTIGSCLTRSGQPTGASVGSARGGRAPQLHALHFALEHPRTESQRDSGLQPRVARHELPWERRPHSGNPNGVVASLRPAPKTRDGLRPGARPSGRRNVRASTDIRTRFARQAFCGVSAALRRGRGATPLGLKALVPGPQGSSCLATLGWRTQSRWDCRGQRSDRPTEAVRQATLRYGRFTVFMERSDRPTAVVRQVVWSLLTSTEFRFNH